MTNEFERDIWGIHNCKIKSEQITGINQISPEKNNAWKKTGIRRVKSLNDGKVLIEGASKEEIMK